MSDLHDRDMTGRAEAIMRSVRTFRLAYGNAEAQERLLRFAKGLFSEAIAVRDTGDTVGAVGRLVRSLELNPRSGEARAELKRLLLHLAERDLTGECLIFPDAERATRFYGNAIQTALDFVTYGGVIGDVLEFGVLGGWTARLFAERMRDMQFYGDLLLFDSFQGLPAEKEVIDRASYDVQRGIWKDDMALPPSLLEGIDTSLPVHIKRMLSRILSASRIKVYEGFYSTTLQEPLGTKAAIVHLDCDLYSSTKEVLAALGRDDVLQDGTVLLFDDWNCNRANPAFGQKRAFAEFLQDYDHRYAASYYFNYGFNCCAFILHDLHALPEASRADAARYFHSGSTIAGPFGLLS